MKLTLTAAVRSKISLSRISIRGTFVGCALAISTVIETSDIVQSLIINVLRFEVVLESKLLKSLICSLKYAIMLLYSLSVNSSRRIVTKSTLPSSIIRLFSSGVMMSSVYFPFIPLNSLSVIAAIGMSSLCKNVLKKDRGHYTLYPVVITLL